MANDFASNFTRKVMMKVADAAEANRVISKKVNTQMFSGAFNPNTGDNVDIKRPTDYVTTKTATGDLTGAIKDIKTGKATATVQDYISVVVDFNEADEALKMGTDASRFWDDIARRIVIDHELDFANYVMRNAALSSGTRGNAVSSFQHVAQAGALLDSVGCPKNKAWNYFLNPYSQVALANETKSLGINPQGGSALARATVSENFAGMSVMTATTLASYTTGAGADRAGTLSAAPTVTYAALKDTYQVALQVAGFQANLEVKAGEQVTIAGVAQLNLATRQPAVNAAGAAIPWTGTVVSDVTLSGTGTGTIVVSGAPIWEAGGAFNTVTAAPANGAVITLLGAAATAYQPNLFFHPDAFSIAYIDIKKLKSTDTVYKSNDGLVMRCSMDSDVITNKQIVRFDLRPAYATIMPYFAGQAFGNA